VDLRERQSLLHHRQLVIDDRLAITGGSLARLETQLEEFRAGMRSELSSIEARLKPFVLRGGDNILVTEVDGVILGLPGEEWRLAAYYALRGFPEPGLVRLFKSLVQPGMVVVDVGAHIGLYTLQAARLIGAAGRVYGFEPAPRTFRILSDNVRVNGFAECNKIILRQVAVSDRAGTANLNLFSAESGHNTLYGSQADTRVTVDTISLDEALREECRVDVVKIDAEGAEPLILRGMREIIARNPQLRILLEFAPTHLQRAGLAPAAFLDQIDDLGLTAMVVEDVTGELLPVDREKLLSAFTANLCLRKRETPGVRA
jgi:FkbM family methyltransferase